MLDVDHGTYPFVTSSQHRRRHRGVRRGRRAGGGRLRAGHRQGLHARGSAPVRSRPSCTTTSASCWATAATSSAPSPGGRRRCGWFDAALVRQAMKVGGVQGLALTKLDVLDGLPELKICIGYRINGDAVPPSAGRAGRAGRGSAGIRGDGRLVRLVTRRPLLGRSAGAGGEICAADRGTGGGAGDPAVHQPGADDTIMVKDPFEG